MPRGIRNPVHLAARLAPALFLGLGLWSCDNPLADKVETIRVEAASPKIVLTDASQPP